MKGRAGALRPVGGTWDSERVTDPNQISRVMGTIDTAKWQAQHNTRETARATKETRELIEQLVDHAVATAEAAEVRERQMLRWTQAGVVLAGIAAVASLIAIIVTIALA